MSRFVLTVVAGLGLGLVGAGAHAVPITYQGTLSNDTASFGDLTATGSNHTNPDPSVSDYWTFFGNAGDLVTITVERLEEAFDPALWIYEGFFSDTASFGGDLGGEPGFLDFADDELPDSGPFGDPQSVIVLTLPGTGQYTAIVTNFLSGPDDGDGLFPYSITANNIVNVPEPASLLLLGLGLAVWGLTSRLGHRRSA